MSEQVSARCTHCTPKGHGDDDDHHHDAVIGGRPGRGTSKLGTGNLAIFPRWQSLRGGRCNKNTQQHLDHHLDGPGEPEGARSTTQYFTIRYDLVYPAYRIFFTRDCSKRIDFASSFPMCHGGLPGECHGLRDRVTGVTS
jgi:hypothetical protein